MSYLDIHNACKVVLLTPGSESTGGTVLNQSNYQQDASGNTVALDGSQGQVMLRVPRFHYSYGFSGSTHTWKVSLNPFDGSAVHPAFTKAGVEVPYRYIGVYPATGYDVSAGTYVDGDGTNSWLDKSNDKLGSVVGYKPISNFNRAQGRQMAANVGAGWQMTDFWLYAMLKLLYITRYADFDSQTVLGAGNTRWSGWDFATRISATGKVLSVTAPGQSTAGGASSDYSNLFGIEDLWGGIWEWVDGWNISSGNNYVCSDPSLFADDTTTNYDLYGSTNPSSNGWQNTLQQNIGLLPESVGASAATKLCDYYWYASGWRVARSGGYADNGSSAGLFSLIAHNSSSGAYSALGGRLCY